MKNSVNFYMGQYFFDNVYFILIYTYRSQNQMRNKVLKKVKMIFSGVNLTNEILESLTNKKLEIFVLFDEM